MATTLGFKDIIDLPEWRPLAVAPGVATVGATLMTDLRNTEDRDPHVYLLNAATTLFKYSMKNDEWVTLASPALGGTWAAGAGGVLAPSCGPYGTLAAGCTTTSVILTTALPAAVGVNQLANRGDGIGYKIRIIGKAAASSGTIEEKTIVGNTGGTTPTITLDSPLAFIPAITDGYELLSGKLFMFSAGALAATIFRSYDVATQALTSLTNTNLIATIATDMTIIANDEAYVPSTKAPYSGYFGHLVSTATSAAYIDGTAAGADAAVLLNEYRNFQVRIVKDVTNPASVGQRRKITGHTAGANPRYSILTNWTSTPTSGAEFVIENNNDIICWNGALTVTYSYLAGYNADAAWSTAAVLGGATQYANPSAAHAAGALIIPSWGITPDTAKYARNSFFYYFRGGVTLDLFDIAGGTTGLWSANIVYGNSGGLSPVAGCGAEYDPIINGGRYGYITVNATQRFARFDVLNRVLEPWAYMRYAQGAVTAGDRVGIITYVDGNTKLTFLCTISSAGATLFSVANQT